jgi:hypothetical protein
LADLTPEHQQIWKGKELTGDYALHPDYYRNSILGEWGTKVSIFEAFIEEMKIINRMAEKMGRPPLFRNDFSEGGKPREFGFLVRPTLKEFNSFVLLLDIPLGLLEGNAKSPHMQLTRMSLIRNTSTTKETSSYKRTRRCRYYDFYWQIIRKPGVSKSLILSKKDKYGLTKSVRDVQNSAHLNCTD